MSKASDAEVIREVSACIDQAIEKNHGRERQIVAGLALLFLTGLGLLVFGAIIQDWRLLVPGGLVQLAIVLPLRQLIRLREDNMRLRILPQLLRLADSREAKSLAAQLVKRLLEKV